MKRFFACMFVIVCVSVIVYYDNTDGTATAIDTVEKCVGSEPLEFAALPDKTEWTIDLDVPVAGYVDPPDYMPKEARRVFRLPDPLNGKLIPVSGNPRQGKVVLYEYGYGMRGHGCLPEELMRINNIKHYEWGVSGERCAHYAYYQRVEKIKDPLLYNSKNHGFLIEYNGDYFQIILLNPSTIHISLLEPPNMSRVKKCKHGWLPRFHQWKEREVI